MTVGGVRHQRSGSGAFVSNRSAVPSLPGNTYENDVQQQQQRSSDLPQQGQEPGQELEQPLWQCQSAQESGRLLIPVKDQVTPWDMLEHVRRPQRMGQRELRKDQHASLQVWSDSTAPFAPQVTASCRLLWHSQALSVLVLLFCHADGA